MCRRNTATGRRVATFHTSAIFPLAVVTHRPLGEKTAEVTGSRSRRTAPRRPVPTPPTPPTSHTRAVLSLAAVTTRRPSGEKAAAFTQPLCPRRAPTSRPVAASHTRAVLSLLAVTTICPSGEKAAEFTAAVCPPKTAITRPFVTSHTRAVSSRLAVTTQRSPRRSTTSLPVATSHKRALRSLLAVTTQRPLWEKPAAVTDPVCPSGVTRRRGSCVWQRIGEAAQPIRRTISDALIGASLRCGSSVVKHRRLPAPCPSPSHETW